MARFCEYQIAHVAVGKTRKRLNIVHFTTIIALVSVGKQGKEQIVGLHREGTMKRVELLPVTDQNRIVAVEKPQKYA